MQMALTSMFSLGKLAAFSQLAHSGTAGTQVSSLPSRWKATLQYALHPVDVLW